MKAPAAVVVIVDPESVPTEQLNAPVPETSSVPFKVMVTRELATNPAPVMVTADDVP